MNDFERDDQWQRQMRDSILVPQFYEQYSTDRRYVLLDKGRFAGLLQKRMAVDTIVQSRDGAVVAIEEKIVRWKGRVYTKFFLETNSCTKPGRESDGWMAYGKADYLLYCFEQEDGSLVAYLVEFPKLCEWFWQVFQMFSPHRMQGTLNETEGRLVDIETVRKNVPTWRLHLLPPEGPEDVRAAA